MNRAQEGLRLSSTLTCPHCRRAETLTMAQDSCLARWVCPACGVMMRPKPGDCCVFCSYGDAPCPPVQRAEACCARE